MKPKRNALVLGAVLAGLLLTSCSSGGADSASPMQTGVTADANGVTVDTKLLAFTPKEIRIAKGQTVTWVGGDSIHHVLVQGEYEVGPDTLRTSQTDDKAFNLDLAMKGQTVSHTYTEAGTFPYYCTIHKGMNGVVIVT
jgi:plastocyanin